MILSLCIVIWASARGTKLSSSLKEKLQIHLMLLISIPKYFSVWDFHYFHKQHLKFQLFKTDSCDCIIAIIILRYRIISIISPKVVHTE